VPSELEWDATKGRAIEDNFEFFNHQRYDPPLPKAALAELDREPADTLALDCMLRNAFAAAEVAKRPFVVLLHMRHGFMAQRQADPTEFEGPRNRLNETRRVLGANPLASPSVESPNVQSWKASAKVLALMPREFEDPGEIPPANVLYVGPIFAEQPNGDWDSPWPTDNTDPLVL
jgi:hypothetical protein